jgi:uncharacterized protein involved in exopolysaccharide biosynthesis
MFSRYWWVMLIGFVVGSAAGLLIAAVITYVMPKQYESSSTVEVKVRPTGFSMRSHRGTSNVAELFTIRPVLEMTVDSLDLTNSWAVDRETAIGILKNKLRVEKIQGTDLLNISALSTNREEVRDLVAAVVKSYSEYVTSENSARLKAGIQELKRFLHEQEQKVGDYRKEIESQHLKPNIAGSQTPDSLDIKSEFESELEKVEMVKLKIISEEMHLSSPAVVIHDDPVINPIPVSPKVTLNLVLGTVSGLVLSPFLTLPIMRLLGRRRRSA